MNRLVWLLIVMRQPPPWSQTWEAGWRSTTPNISGHRQKENYILHSVFFFFFSIYVVNLARPATYLEINMKEWGAHTSLPRLCSVQQLDHCSTQICLDESSCRINPPPGGEIRRGGGGDISTSIEGCAGKISPGLLGCWGQTQNPILF